MNQTQAEDEWECGISEDHEWRPGDIECRRCGADLGTWNEQEETSEDDSQSQEE